jgi:hypothetical protein
MNVIPAEILSDVVPPSFGRIGERLHLAKLSASLLSAAEEIPNANDHLNNGVEMPVLGFGVWARWSFAG